MNEASHVRPAAEFRCRTSDIDDCGMVSFEAPDGTWIVVGRVGDEFYAVDDRCTHERARLSDGYLADDYVIECPLHGGSFDIRTGIPATFPCVVPVRTHAVAVDGDEIVVRPGG